MASVVMRDVTSSNVAKIGHNPELNELHVMFKTGKTYIYEGVEAAVHDAMLAAESVGKFFDQNIKRAGIPFRTL